MLRQMRPLLRRVVATAAALSLVGSVGAGTLSAFAQSPAVISSGDPAIDALAGSSHAPGSSGERLAETLGTLETLGSSQFPVPNLAALTSSAPQNSVDESITVAEIVDKRSESDPQLQRWTVASPALGRAVDVQVQASDEPAPVLYLLDGADSGPTSGWVEHGDVVETLGAENVTVVMPTTAAGGLYTDWYADDPTLGRNQWETFLTEELPPLVESEVDSTDRRAIGGLSMGAGGAVALANRHPELYDGVFGLSGCYSLSSAEGFQTARVTVESRGGSFENVFGPPGSPGWEHFDTTADPSGLRDMAVYLAAGSGAISPADAAANSSVPLAGAIVLEQGSRTCTEDLLDAMAAQGMTHQRAVLPEEGTHTWNNWAHQLGEAWRHISPALDAG